MIDRYEIQNSKIYSSPPIQRDPKMIILKEEEEASFQHRLTNPGELIARYSLVADIDVDELQH